MIFVPFWDTFFGATAGISYHNRHTAFPRVSKLDDFLTRPCPVAVGVIQCEIERIRKVDQSVKGRLFPTYEYRYVSLTTIIQVLSVILTIVYSV